LPRRSVPRQSSYYALLPESVHRFNAARLRRLASHRRRDGRQPRISSTSQPTGRPAGQMVKPRRPRRLQLLSADRPPRIDWRWRPRCPGRPKTSDELSDPIHTIGTRDWPRVGRSGSLNDQGRVPSPAIKIPMARNNVAVVDYQVHEIDRVHQFFRGPVRTRLAYPDLIAPVLRLKIHIPHDLPHLM
jgi:hypothetical protein